MNELDTIRRAEVYLRKLSQGIDPITDTEVPADSVLDQVRLARCFAFTADILRRLADEGGFPLRRPRARKGTFVIPDGLDLTVLVCDETVQITRLVQAVRDLCYPGGDAPRLSAPTVTGWLVQQGYLEDQTTPQGTRRRVPTQAGRALGMTMREAEGVNGPYAQVRYGAQAQRLILSSLPAILAEKQAERAE